ncbi:YtxH domain-containing protein [Salicibibacter kimchii]|nr:YtxH domain-containing protein [Salicibibacter kimchii]
MNRKDVLIGVVIGAMIGAMTTLLTAPKSGKAVRGDLQEQTTKLKNKTADAANTVSEQSSRASGQVQDAASQMSETTAETAKRFLDEVTSSGNEDRAYGRE